tara:strand:+ start:266 stop:421 length:156 start_codon:yes stop_codon:yes gene_type:complete
MKEEEDKKIMMHDTLSMHINKRPTDCNKEGEEVEGNNPPPSNNSSGISLDT